MELLNSILYDTVYHSAPIILCVIGGIFAYKANVLNIALEGMMLNGAFISVLVEYLTGSVALAVIAAIVTTDMLPSYRTMKYKSPIWGYFHVQKE